MKAKYLFAHKGVETSLKNSKTVVTKFVKNGFYRRKWPNSKIELLISPAGECSNGPSGGRSLLMVSAELNVPNEMFEVRINSEDNVISFGQNVSFLNPKPNMKNGVIEVKETMGGR